MNEREVRMRAIEAVSHSGIREPQRIVNDAKILAEWVMSAEDKATPPKRATKKAADKAETPA